MVYFTMTELQEKLKLRFNYDPDRGIFTKIGEQFTFWPVKNGRKYACFNGRTYVISRLIVLYMTGKLPIYTGFVDGDVDNFVYSNVFACEKKWKSKGKAGDKSSNTKPIRVSVYDECAINDDESFTYGLTRTPNIDKLLIILDALDEKPRSRGYLLRTLTLSKKTVVDSIIALVNGRQIEKNKITGLYTLAPRGHCRILTEQDERNDKRMKEHILFYRIMPSIELPLGGRNYGDGCAEHMGVEINYDKYCI